MPANNVEWSVTEESAQMTVKKCAMAQSKMLALITAGILGCFSESAIADSQKNLNLMIEAARQLEFDLPENRPYLLIKHGQPLSPVAVIFGYVDNEAACRQISQALTNSGLASYECDAVFQ